MKRKKQILDNSINVPVTTPLKRRVQRLAKKHPGKIKLTAYTRRIIEHVVTKLESGSEQLQ